MLWKFHFYAELSYVSIRKFSRSQEFIRLQIIAGSGRKMPKYLRESESTPEPKRKGSKIRKHKNR